MKAKLEAAFDNYDQGARPENYREARNWFVVGPRQVLYPAKCIWALATGTPLRDFNTREARVSLAEHDYSLVELGSLVSEDSVDSEVRSAQILNPEQRRVKLDNSPRLPPMSLVVIRTFRRNPLVVAEVLSRAGGKCEGCDHDAPFKRASDGTDYLEVHHNIRLADGGEDTVENAVALCPNCHRKAHFG